MLYRNKIYGNNPAYKLVVKVFPYSSSIVEYFNTPEEVEKFISGLKDADLTVYEYSNDGNIYELSSTDNGELGPATTRFGEQT